MKKIVVAAVCLCLSACVTVKNAPMGEAAAGSLQGQSIAHTARKKPAFSAMTAGKAMFGGLGAVAMITEGNAIIEKNNVDDPANAIAEGLTQALAAKHGSTVAAVVDDLEGFKVEQVAARAGAARYVLDVRTINWSFVYFPTDWNHYRVLYSAQARLIDAKTKAVVAEGFCARVPDKADVSLTYDAMQADGWTGLKTELAAAGAYCLEKFRTETFNL